MTSSSLSKHEKELVNFSSKSMSCVNDVNVIVCLCPGTDSDLIIDTNRSISCLNVSFEWLNPINRRIFLKEPQNRRVEKSGTCLDIFRSHEVVTNRFFIRVSIDTPHVRLTCELHMRKMRPIGIKFIIDYVLFSSFPFDRILFLMEFSFIA